MKKFILITALLIVISYHLNAQWEILNEGFKGSFNTIDFVDENIGWIAGGCGLLKTTDGGENWFTVPIDENWYINQVDFINDSLGWGIGSQGISKTSDGGLNWSVQKEIDSIWLSSIYVIDKNNVYTAGSHKYPKIFKTTDGGIDWVDISPEGIYISFNSMWFQNPKVGLVIGNYSNGTRSNGIILRTTSGGDSWEKSILNEYRDISDLQFINDTVGYFIARNDTNNFLCKTEDLCKTWTIKARFSSGFDSYQFLDSTTAYAIVSDSLTYITKSTDGGVNWLKIQTVKGSPNKIYFSNSKTCFLLNIFFLSRSTDSGRNWENSRYSHFLTDVYFITKDKGFVGGNLGVGVHSRGYLLSTTNSGNSWSFENNPLGIFTSITFLNDSTGFVLENFGIYKSSNTGKDWFQVYNNNIEEGCHFYGNDICFNNDGIGWAVGHVDSSWANGYGILVTKNYGDDWNWDWKHINTDYINTDYYALNSVYVSETATWTVGDAGMIVKYTPQKGWEKQTPVTDLPLKKVFAVENNVWITGGYQSENNFFTILLKTTNNGDTWEINNNINYLFNDILFVNNQHGWAVGCDSSYKGVILETKDGGDNWNIVVDNLIDQLNSIFVKDNNAWAVGYSGLVLRTTNLGATWIDDDNKKVYPTEFKLEQNYPNPFNPTTKIRYSIPLVETGHAPSLQRVTLKIYDILGRGVATLVNEEKSPGNYEVEFNAVTHSDASLPSGVYFYRLTTGSYSATKKMLLLK